MFAKKSLVDTALQKSQESKDDATAAKKIALDVRLFIDSLKEESRRAV